MNPSPVYPGIRGRLPAFGGAAPFESPRALTVVQSGLDFSIARQGTRTRETRSRIDTGRTRCAATPPKPALALSFRFPRHASGSHPSRGAA